MKKNWNIFIICCLSTFIFACQSEDELGSNATGYLRLGLEVNTSSNTRAEAAYNPEQLAVQIINASNEVVEETTNFETNWQGKTIELPVGTYTVKASSAGFDGKTSAFDKPYYAGSTKVTVKSKESANATIECTLANVKVTVNFDQSFKDAFKKANVEVDDKAGDTGIDPLDFIMGTTTQSGYFPVTDLKATVSATNKNDVTNTQMNEITGVKARDHYILNYKVGTTTGGNVTIEVDPATKTYTFNIDFPLVLPDQPTLAVSFANAWAKLVYLEGTMNGNNVVEVDPTKVAFEYREKKAEATDEDWKKVSSTNEEGTYKATITGLTPETTYESRLVYGEENTFISDVKEFTTEPNAELTNGDFEDWCIRSAKTAIGNKDTTFPCSATDYDAGNIFWDTSNRGANSMGTIDPTNKIESPVVTGTYAARLKSEEVYGVLAAASLYTGTFDNVTIIGMEATINFGQPFTSRPIALHGYYQYTPVNIEEVSDNLPEDANVSEGGPDQCAIYIALATKTYSVNNKDKSTFINFENDENIIAYGTLEGDNVTFGEKEINGYTEFTIPLRYKTFTKKPTHIIVVCSASKYGDYMVGGIGSTLYVDNFSLVYDGKPAAWE